MGVGGGGRGGGRWGIGGGYGGDRGGVSRQLHLLRPRWGGSVEFEGGEDVVKAPGVRFDRLEARALARAAELSRLGGKGEEEVGGGLRGEG